MGPLSSVAGQIVRFTDNPAPSIFWGPPGLFGAGGAVDNNKTPYRPSLKTEMFEGLHTLVIDSYTRWK